jgi:hypothetical protein
MRVQTLISLAAAAAALACVATPEPAAAFGSDPLVAPEGRDFAIGARKRAGRGECEGESTMCDDAYGYRYVRRPWYPGYNSGYWVPADEMRNRYRYSYTGPKYRYHPAWGVDRDGQGHADIDRDGKPMK